MSDKTMDIPAFPQPLIETRDGAAVGPDHPGMKLRDYFAGQVITGLLASDAHPDIELERLMITDAQVMRRARFAYRVADALMWARQEGK